MLMGGGCFRAICATNAPPTKRGGNPMKKHRIERNLLFPSKEFRDRVRSAASERGFRSEQAFILTACELELRQGDNTEATAQLRPALRPPSRIWQRRYSPYSLWYTPKLPSQIRCCSTF